jgi:hypothetical protein
LFLALFTSPPAMTASSASLKSLSAVAMSTSSAVGLESIAPS